MAHAALRLHVGANRSIGTDLALHADTSCHVMPPRKAKQTHVQAMSLMNLSSSR